MPADTASYSNSALVGARLTPRPVLAKALRIALNPRTNAEPAGEFDAAITWVKRHSGTVRGLEDVDTFRRLMAALDKKGDGTRASPDTIRLRRTPLVGVIDYAIEKEALSFNPLKKVKVRKNRTALREIEAAAVVSPMQARTLLNAVRENSPRLVAFFGLMYFGGLQSSCCCCNVCLDVNPIQGSLRGHGTQDRLSGTPAAVRHSIWFGQ